MRATDGRQLRAARAGLGLTIDQVAELAGVNRNSVMRAEKIETFRNDWAAERISLALEGAGAAFCKIDRAPYVFFPARPRRHDQRRQPVRMQSVPIDL